MLTGTLPAACPWYNMVLPPEKDQIYSLKLPCSSRSFWTQRALLITARIFRGDRKLREEKGLCDYFWSFSGGRTILYRGHDAGAVPVSNGLSDRISKDLKKRGFQYVGPVTIYSHLQACGIINDHDKSCPCYQRINDQHPTVSKRRDHEVKHP